MTNTTSLSEQINQAILAAISLLKSNNEIVISPASVAKLVADKYAAGDSIEWHLLHAANMEFRQRARGFLRMDNATSEIQVEQSDLFDGKLQDRYPCKRNGEEVYVLRGYMSIAELRENSQRLRREGEAKLKHSDALEEEAARRERD